MDSENEAVIKTETSKKTSIDEEVAADFETAVSATEYGYFNYFLILLSIPCCTTSVFATSVMSYVLPSAECDLSLSLYDKGILNAVTYLGMIISAFPWGYLADTLGRKKLLVYGYFLNSICEIICAFSQTFWFLITFKFIGGLIITGPFAVLMSFLCEFHGLKHRARVMLGVGIYFSMANIILPMLALVILPNDWTITVIKGFIVLRSWQIFLIICSLPSFISGIIVSFFPESPKFLMSQGRNDEAMKVFQTVYKLNTGKSKNEYPIKILINEIQQEITTTSKNIEAFSNNKIKTKPKGLMALKNGMSQITPMFRTPYLINCILVFTIEIGLLLGLNTLRLWVPQLFSITTNFEENNNSLNTSLCAMIEENIHNSVSKFDDNNMGNCTVMYTSQMYLNSMYIGITTGIGYLLAGALINAIGNKNLLLFCLCISGLSGMGLYWAKNSMVTVILSASYITLASIASTSLIGITVNLFPTSLRTMTVSLAMMFGRMGAVIGNLIFPFLLSLGCFQPFFMVGSVVAVGAFFALFLPQTNKKPLK